jgi:hypothetical protein
VFVHRYLIAMNEKLIESVKQHKELYDMSHRKYSDNAHKEKLWKTIGEQLKKAGETQYFIRDLFTSASNFLTLHYRINGYKLFLLYAVCHHLF